MQVELSLNTTTLHHSKWRNPQKEIHKRNGKSWVRWYDNGQKAYEGYCLNGEAHNPKGPAVTRWFANGQKYSEYYYINGEYHNAKGPAVTRWNEEGQKYYEYYFINGVHLTKGQWEQ